ncbi:N-acetylglucosamine-6-phosphate deacetylase [Neobacillus drentensis]|uniref:N-acetylglucosamine-6-phosphate deacetylase n=1 Tax=Neobacillus drentensis TaxID=220684 RepID=UPI00285D3E31|nr:N-acetylglucosamine-6-phosphate deacetylase [Neobacillus drentensis]MDR7238863.1 N-acetylglucosamine-6-phosphate deacetylase [Neobacillus drentensis]
MERFVLKGKNIYTGNRVIESGFLLIEDGVITSIGTDVEFNRLDLQGGEVIEVDATCSIIPGMIDMHIHGAAGSEVMDATPQALDIMTANLPSEGTTSFLATTLTEAEDSIKRALHNVGEFMRAQPTGQAEILGIHLEGPFISPSRPGAQSQENIICPDLEKFAEFQRIADHHILQVTMAPERPGGMELVRYLSSHGVVVSIGHSNATSDEVQKAIEAGAKQVTHLFNAMSPIHHRDPGVAGSALMADALKCELIVDGIHIHPAVVHMAFRLKGSEGLILVTDAIRAKCLGEGSYRLGNQTVQVRNGRALLEDGTLAGSILTMKESIKNTLTFTGCTLEDIVFMSSINPAKQLNLFHRKGSLETGKDADVVVLNEHMDVLMTLCRGKVAYQK